MISKLLATIFIGVMCVFIAHAQTVARSPALSLPEMVEKYMGGEKIGPQNTIKSFQRLKNNLVRDTVQYSTAQYTLSFTRNALLKSDQEIPETNVRTAEIYYGEAHFSKYDPSTGRITGRHYLFEKQKSGQFYIFNAKPQTKKTNTYSAWQKSSLVTQKNSLQESLQFLGQISK